MICTFTSTQVLYANSTKEYDPFFIYRLRNYGDLEAIVEELSAIYGKKTLLQICHEAVSEDYSSLYALYVNLMSKDKRKCSWRDFINI